nr:TetR/AcrR family transcriptional regulator [Deltaproteobacteria bacterium]
MSKRDTILQAATRLFSKKGFKQTSIAELSKTTGAAEGTIFYHFKNKENIFLCILKDTRNRVIAELNRYVEEEKFGTGLDMIEGVCSFYFYLAGKMEEQFLLLHRRHPHELAEVNPVCREHLEAIYNSFVNGFEQAILIGQKDGSIREMSPKRTALIIFSMVDGLVRFKTYNLYSAGALHKDFLELCRAMLQKKIDSGVGNSNADKNFSIY